MIYRKIYVVVGVLVMAAATKYLTGWPAINDGWLVSSLQNKIGSVSGNNAGEQSSQQEIVVAPGATNKDGVLNKNERINKKETISKKETNSASVAKSDPFSYQPAQGWASPEIMESEAKLLKLVTHKANLVALAKGVSTANEINNSAVSRSELPAPRADIVYTEFSVSSRKGESVKIAVPESATKMPDALVNMPDLPGASGHKYSGATQFSR